ncbi:hypothetical protein GPALN_005867 [Globodera pallida]|nr:hypothetical protein GPALN_005867 [Globodera pallida]
MKPIILLVLVILALSAGVCNGMPKKKDVGSARKMPGSGGTSSSTPPAAERLNLGGNNNNRSRNKQQSQQKKESSNPPKMDPSFMPGLRLTSHETSILRQNRRGPSRSGTVAPRQTSGGSGTCRRRHSSNIIRRAHHISQI